MIAIRSSNKCCDTCAVESIPVKSLITFTGVVTNNVVTGGVLVAVVVVHVETFIDV